jgi:polysaccharide biosynthesis transport protein
MMDTMEHPRPAAPGEKPKRPERAASLTGAKGGADFDLRQILGLLRRRKSVIGASVLITTIVAAAVVLQITPRYTAEATLLLDPQKTHIVDMQAVISGLPVDSAAIRSELELVKTPAIAESVVKKLDLTAVPEFNPSLNHPPAAKAWLAPLDGMIAAVEPLLGLAAPTPPVAANPEQAALQAAVGALLARTQVTNDGRSYILKLNVTSENPQLAAAIANAYADAYLVSQLETKFEAVRRANAWLNDQLTELRAKVRDTDDAVQLFKAQHNLTESKGTTVTAQQLTEINTQLIIAGADRAQKESNLKQVQDQLKTGGIDAVAPTIASPLIQRLREQEADLVRQEADLATRYKPAHPAMLNIKAQERDLRQKIRDEVNKYIVSMQGDANAARAKEASLRATLEQLQKSTANEDQSEVQLRELERESQANRTLYESFLNRFKQTSAQEDLQQPDARLVTAAKVPGAASYPKRGMIIGLAFTGSWFLGLLMALAVERLDNGFRTGDQLEALAQVPTLGLIPDVKVKEDPMDVIVRHPVSPYSEAVRTVRTALRYSDIDHPPKVVLVTSSVPDEGKTVFATSLARSVARSGGKSLLIDCDLRRPSIAKALKTESQPGLLSLFEQDAGSANAIRVDESCGMHFLTVTGGISNPQDLLGSKHMRAIIEEMRERYDLIVLDSPPVLAVSDPLILSHIADTTMFLVRWERTPRQVVQGALKTFRANGGHLAGVVLTRANLRRHASYGYGDSGYYYGRYGSYYGSYGGYGGKS